MTTQDEPEEAEPETGAAGPVPGSAPGRAGGDGDGDREHERGAWRGNERCHVATSGDADRAGRRVAAAMALHRQEDRPRGRGGRDDLPSVSQPGRGLLVLSQAHRARRHLVRVRPGVAGGALHVHDCSAADRPADQGLVLRGDVAADGQRRQLDRAGGRGVRCRDAVPDARRVGQRAGDGGCRTDRLLVARHRRTARAPHLRAARHLGRDAGCQRPRACGAARPRGLRPLRRLRGRGPDPGRTAPLGGPDHSSRRATVCCASAHQ